MARHLTSNTLIDSIVRRCMIPQNQVTFTDADFLAFANEEMDMAVIPYVLSFHEDYFLRTESIPTVQNQSAYPIPYRAIGNKLRDVSYSDLSRAIFEMTRVGVGDAPFYQFSGGNGTGLRVFYVKNNDIVLLPEDAPNIVGSLNMSYYMRPNSLVAENAVAHVMAIDTVTGIISLDAIPETFTVGIKYDLLQTQSPHKSLAIDVTPTAISTLNKTITFSISDIPTSLAVGDYVALAEQCIIPQIPTDLHSLLAQRVACRCLEALGDQQGLTAANAKLQEMELKGASIIDSRVEDAPLKVNNRHSFLKRYRTYFRR